MTAGRMTVDLDAGPWTTATLAMARDVATQGRLTIEVASTSPRPVPAPFSSACRITVDGPVAVYALWSGSTLVATCRAPRRREPVGVPLLLGGRRLVASDRFTRLVVGVDNADAHSMTVVEAGAALAATIGASLTLVEIVEPPDEDVDVPDSAHLHHVGARLSRRPDEYDTVRSSEPGSALLRYVGRRTDTIIVLGLARSDRRRLLRRVVRSSPCPVLLVPTTASCP